MILVTGFGSFPGVPDNPAARSARAVHGLRAGAHEIVARVLPVTYDGGPAETIAWALENRPAMVIGLGVAMSRPGVTVERYGRRRCDPGLPDASGACLADLGGPDEIVGATIDVDRLAEALGATVSEDAGAYVCNAWLYRVSRGLPGIPTGFVHVPAEGIAPERLMGALGQVLPLFERHLF